MDTKMEQLMLDETIMGLIEMHALAMECGLPTVQTVIGNALTRLAMSYPQLLDLEEIPKHEGAMFMEIKGHTIEPMWVVYRNEQKPYVMFMNGGAFPGTFGRERDDYGQTWRCWTARPSEAQMKNTRWK